MTHTNTTAPAGPEQEPLVTRLSVVEGMDITERAAGYVAIYDELRERLEGGDTRA